jgi:hypothetical protein
VFGDESDELRRAILKFLNQSKRMVLNLASIAYIESSGLDTLVTSFIFAVIAKPKSNLPPRVDQHKPGSVIWRLRISRAAVKVFIPHRAKIGSFKEFRIGGSPRYPPILSRSAEISSPRLVYASLIAHLYFLFTEFEGVPLKLCFDGKFALC